MRNILLIPLLSGSVLLSFDALAEQRDPLKKFEGLWVTAEAAKNDACSQVKSDDDAMGSGEGVLLIRQGRYYSQETQCSLSKVKGGDENQVSAAFSCAGNKVNVIFYLQANQSLITAVFYSSDSYIEVYDRRCKY